MSRRSSLVMAALASDAMPDLSVAAAHDVRFDGLRDDPFDRAVILDSHGEEYDIAVTDDEAIGVLLGVRARNSSVLSRARESGTLGYRVEHVCAYRQGRPSVLICTHLEGEPIDLDLLTDTQCAAVGTAIGALHRMDPEFLRAEGFPMYSSEQIRGQFGAWVDHLRKTRRVPGEITTRWHQLASMDELWEFATVPVHGGFGDGDFMFGPQGIEAMLNWEHLQVNDPARDLAWLFSGILAPAQQDAVLSAYGRLMGSRMDSRIVSRAKLWLQMATVTDFIKALEEADSSLIKERKQLVDELAADLAPIRPPAQDGDGTGRADGSSRPRHARDDHGGTLTVGTLLRNGETMALPESARPKDDVPADDQTAPSDAVDDTAGTSPDETDAFVPTAANPGAPGDAGESDETDEPDDDTDVHPVTAYSVVSGPSLGDWIAGSDEDRPTGYVSLDDTADPSDGEAPSGVSPSDGDDTPAANPSDRGDGTAARDAAGSGSDPDGHDGAEAAKATDVAEATHADAADAGATDAANETAKSPSQVPDEPIFQPSGNINTVATIMLTQRDIAAMDASAASAQAAAVTAGQEAGPDEHVDAHGHGDDAPAQSGNEQQSGQSGME